MDIINKIRARAKLKIKTIALPEIEDKRVKEAAGIIEKEGFAKVLLFGRGMLDKARQDEYAKSYYELRKIKGISLEEAKKTLEDPLYYAAMMAHNGEIDGFVAGASHTTPDVARAAIHCLGVEKEINIASSCFLMVVPDSPYGEAGAFVFADCGIVPDPNSRQLASIAIANAGLAQQVLGVTPKVAFLSYSTKGSAKGRVIDKTLDALALAKKMRPDLLIDGELQVDAAIVPEVAEIKYPDSLLKGRANVLIFPNLEAGNIGYKLVERLAKARAIGPLIVGLNKPCSDLSRGCSAEDIVDCVAVTAIRAQ
ncbi:MAG: phosphate acetyltransferase [Candidatus Omnitrophica bacterium]|nr:phosphate acetyltransferase [Candidatus Omnitrophota bacterium]MDD5592035.1 phosphate acetyltransferase [Candidatus Omnitrophota bacterium]